MSGDTRAKSRFIGKG